MLHLRPAQGRAAALEGTSAASTRNPGMPSSGSPVARVPGRMMSEAGDLAIGRAAAVLAAHRMRGTLLIEIGLIG